MTLVAFDIGGTNLRAAAVGRDGRILASHTQPTSSHLGARVGLEAIADAARQVATRAGGSIEAVGIGITGPVDHRTGRIDNPHTLPGWEGLELVGELRRLFDVPVAVDNDANAAALGEWWLGTGQRPRRLAAVTLGTGIGVGIVDDGEPLRTRLGHHGEAGHMLLDPAGPPCYCGANGCWEVLASGRAIQRLARERGMVATDGSGVGAAARHGDFVALEVVAEVGAWIGRGLVNLMAVACPEVIALTGSVADDLDLYEPAIQAQVERHSTMIPIADTRVLKATTGSEAGLLGAAYSARVARAAHD